jgi:hypothetical protein
LIAIATHINWILIIAFQIRQRHQLFGCKEKKKKKKKCTTKNRQKSSTTQDINNKNSDIDE